MRVCALCLSRNRPTIQCSIVSLNKKPYSARSPPPPPPPPLRIASRCARGRPSTQNVSPAVRCAYKAFHIEARPTKGLCRPWRRFSAASATRYRAQYANNRSISLSPLVATTSSRMHGEFLRLCFLPAHRQTANEKTGPVFSYRSASAARPGQALKSINNFRFRRAVSQLPLGKTLGTYTTCVGYDKRKKHHHSLPTRTSSASVARCSPMWPRAKWD